MVFFVLFFGSTGAVYYWTIICGARHSITTVAKTVNNVKMNRQSLDFTRERDLSVSYIISIGYILFSKDRRKFTLLRKRNGVKNIKAFILMQSHSGFANN